MDRMSRWDEGPSIVPTALSYAFIDAMATDLWPQACLIRVFPY